MIMWLDTNFTYAANDPLPQQIYTHPNQSSVNHKHSLSSSSVLESSSESELGTPTTGFLLTTACLTGAESATVLTSGNDTTNIMWLKK